MNDRKVRIVGANLRDLSFIAANLRPDDKREIDCQWPGWTPAGLALAALQGTMAYVCEIDGNPEAAFGVTPMTPNPGLWIAFSWGSKRMWRCVPLITEFVRDVMMPDMLASTAHRLEARAMSCHVSAHRWLRRMGARWDCTLHGYGSGGESFELYSWTRNARMKTPVDVVKPGFWPDEVFVELEKITRPVAPETGKFCDPFFPDLQLLWTHDKER